MFAIILYLFLSIFFPLSNAEFHQEFEDFLTLQYGKQVSDRLSRRDFGAPGAFGGGGLKINGELERSDVQPTILVHGVVGLAGHLNRIRWKIRGGKHVFATTWGEGPRKLAPGVEMKCDDVKQIRMLIQSVAAYTRRKVDVIGYSMGSPIARKAIMGGPCVDTHEALGPPLTPLVDTFVSVAGANQGSVLCILPFPGTCNIINGINCFSQYIRDLNSRQGYEGKYVFSIFTKGDDKVGYNNGCGSKSTTIHGVTKEIEVQGNHDSAMFDSWKQQIALIDKHNWP